MSSQLLTILLLIYLSLPAGKSDLAADRAALLSLRAAVGGRTLLWNATAASPCGWSGVKCDAGAAGVVALRLPAVSLVGELPSGSIGALTRLRTLSLRFNALSGRLPADFGALSELRSLYLQHNRFSGEIPAEILSLHRLVRLSLAGNSFSGKIPPNLGSLTRLKTLHLQDNQFTGSLPDLKLDLEQFNVSNNKLNGSIPVSLSSMPASAFSGNRLCGRPLSLCAATVVPPAIAGIGMGNEPRKKKKLSGGAIAGIVIGSVLGFMLILLILFLLCRKKKMPKTSSVDAAALKHLEREFPAGKLPGEGENNNGLSVAAAAAAAMEGKGEIEVGTVGGGGGKKLVFFGNSGPSRVFDLEDLLRASAEVLGKGTFGTAYKAVLEVGTVVTVKRLKDVTITEREFREKIEFVGGITDHQNLVPLRAYYYSREEKLLVYDYMPMGSLSALLHGNKGTGRTPLNWELRSSIALGAAQGIRYLHSQGPSVSHGNIKSSNILLTKSHQARVSDFGLAHLVGPSSSTPNRVSTGYRAPEVTDPRKVSQKADVYSFGVLLLELLTGKAPTHALLNEEGVDLPRWVQSVVKEEWTSEVFDIELLTYQTEEEEMVQLLQLAMDCATQHPDNRPTMSEVAVQIEDICRSSSLTENNQDNPQPDRVSEEY